MTRNTLRQSAEETRIRLQGRPRPAITPINGTTRVSFEFFPPASDEAASKFRDTIAQLAPLEPDFVSVTYGAGGSSQSRTVETLAGLNNNFPATAGHLTCVGANRATTDRVVDSYIESGIRHIVALRGDSPDGHTKFVPHADGYQNAAELVGGIRKRTRHIKDFRISVAAYPEVHPDSPNAALDMDNLKKKIDAGADCAITQFFFDPDVYLDFRDRALTAGISAPIIPGILPVTNFSKVVEFSKRCGASVPAWMTELFDGLDHSPEIRRLVAATVTAELCTRLIDQGVSSFHFYTLNRPELTRAICHIMGVRASTIKRSQRAAGE